MNNFIDWILKLFGRSTDRQKGGASDSITDGSPTPNQAAYYATAVHHDSLHPGGINHHTANPQIGGVATDAATQYDTSLGGAALATVSTNDLQTINNSSTADSVISESGNSTTAANTTLDGLISGDGASQDTTITTNGDSLTNTGDSTNSDGTASGQSVGSSVAATASTAPVAELAAPPPAPAVSMVASPTELQPGATVAIDQTPPETAPPASTDNQATVVDPGSGDTSVATDAGTTDNTVVDAGSADTSLGSDGGVSTDIPVDSTITADNSTGNAPETVAAGGQSGAAPAAGVPAAVLGTTTPATHHHRKHHKAQQQGGGAVAGAGPNGAASFPHASNYQHHPRNDQGPVVVGSVPQPRTRSGGWASAEVSENLGGGGMAAPPHHDTDPLSVEHKHHHKS